MLDRDITAKYFLDMTHEESAAEWSDLINICVKETENMLRRGKSIDGAMEQLCYAAAALAFYRFTLKNAAAVTTFKAGEVSLSADKSVDCAGRLYKQALGAVKEYISRDDFAFITV